VHFPTGRFGEAIEQAHAVVFLASDESSFVNGSDFVVDGGMTKVRSLSPDENGLKIANYDKAYVTPEGPAPAAPQNQGS
jgi:hypothetical protein